jgi:hypothetical protein
MVAVLFVDLEKTTYRRVPGVKVLYGSIRNKVAIDAMRYSGPFPLVAHPPCAPWGAFRGFLKDPDSSIDGKKSCAIFSIGVARRFGGVVEHPLGSSLWKHMDLPLPGRGSDRFGGWTMRVDQVNFGHPCIKPTWLYVVGVDPGNRIFSGLPTGKAPAKCIRRWKGCELPYCTKGERKMTPFDFAVFLVRIAGEVGK